jgi:lysozyme family protein
MCAMKQLGVEPTLANLKALTDDQAGRVYKALYWDDVGCDDYMLQELANIVFDFHVNAGAQAPKLLQRVLNDMGADPQLEVDGDIGQATMTALAGMDATEVYRRYKQGRIKYYQDLVAKRPALAKFLKGWLNRANSFPDL